ncbi:hypothetical protein EVAR_35987_1 [Eumeta japonica]|uniref:Uncharacterized protein n=1 Tax=Eumeta variegata TaxID=151549 RepID=A0A4C1WU85_EUMVA|nr:hypothetical protein EVAR_35987_1 [Eumeta japonica]
MRLKIEAPFLAAVESTLGDRYTPNVESIYKITIKFILETLIEGYEKAGNKPATTRRDVVLLIHDFLCVRNMTSLRNFALHYGTFVRVGRDDETMALHMAIGPLTYNTGDGRHERLSSDTDASQLRPRRTAGRITSSLADGPTVKYLWST